MNNTETPTTTKRYIVRAGGPTHTTAHASWWLVIDTAKQDAIVIRASDRAHAERQAEMLNAIDAL